MTVATQPIIQTQVMTAAAAPYYTSANVKTIIDKLTVTNTSTTDVAVISIYLVPERGSASNATIIVKNKPIFTEDTYTFPEVSGHTLASGDMIMASSSLTTSVIRASGRILT